MAAPKITTGYTQPGTKLIVKPDIAKYTDKNGKVSAKYQTDLTNFYAKSTDPEAVKYRTDELTKKYGSLKDADGKAIFTPTYIKALAEGVEPPASLDKAVTDWATAKMKDATNYDWNNFSGGIGSVAAQNLLSSFVKDPSQVDTALTFKSSGADVTPEQKQANAANLEAKVAKAEKDTVALENYDPNAGTWNPSKNTQATPYGDVLSGLISGYKNPYAANYVNPLAAVEKPNLTNIQTPFNKNAIPQDLVSLFNSAGTNYAGGTRANPLVRPTLPNNGLVKLTQPSATESAEQLAKPGAPDTTNTTLPVVTDKPPVVTDKPPVVTDKPPVVTDKPPVVTDKPPVVTDKPANWGYVKTPEEIAAEKAAADKVAAEQKAVENARIAAEQKAIEDARIAAEKAVAVRAQDPYTTMDATGLPPVITPTVTAKAQDPYSTMDAMGTTAEKTTVADRNKASYGPVSSFYGGLAPPVSVSPPVVESIPPAQRDLGPQQVTLDPNTVVSSPSGINALSAQTVALPPSGPQPINPSNGGPTSATVGPITAAQRDLGPQQVTLDPNTVVSSPSGINALSAQTVALPPSGPQPINPSNGGPTSATVGPITAAQRDLGPLNISNLGAVIGPQAMNSNAGGVASLVGPQVTVQQQPAAGTNTVLAPSPSQKPAVVQQTPQNPWDKMGISQQDYYENYW